MPIIGETKMRYPGNDPENGPAFLHRWNGERWTCANHKFIVVSFPADEEGPEESWEQCKKCGCLKGGEGE